MPSCRRSRLVAVASGVVGLAVLGATGAAGSTSHHAWVKYRVQATAHYSVQVTSPTSGVAARSVVTQTYPSFPLAVHQTGLSVEGKTATGVSHDAIAGRPGHGSGTAEVTLAVAGCTHALKKRVEIPFEFSLGAFKPFGPRVSLGETVIPARYGFGVRMTTLNRLSLIPGYPHKCAHGRDGLKTVWFEDQNTGLIDVLSTATRLDVSGLAEAGARPGFRDGSDSVFLGFFSFQQYWNSRPPQKPGGGYRFPAPLAAIAAGKKLVITRNLASTETSTATFVSGETADAKIVRTGRITFTFVPVKR